MTNVKPLLTMLINSKLANLVITTLIILIIKSVVKLPIPQRGISANGLYTFLNEFQFKETAFFTFFIILYIAFSRLKIRLNWALLLAIGATFGNLAVMIIDARYQTYYIDIETIIAHYYGSPIQIYAIAIGLLFIAISILITAFFAQIEDNKLLQREKYKYYYRFGYLLLLLIGGYLLFTINFFRFFNNFSLCSANFSLFCK